MIQYYLSYNMSIIILVIKLTVIHIDIFVICIFYGDKSEYFILAIRVFPNLKALINYLKR